MTRYRGNKASRNVLKLGKLSDYVPAKLAAQDEKTLRKEYSRLRDIAQKRLKRMDESGWDWTEEYKQNRYAFAKTSMLKEKRDLQYKLSQVARFLTSSRGSVSGLKESTQSAIDTLHQHGYDFVNMGNFKEFADFMEWARSLVIGRMYDSDRIAEKWGDLRGKFSRERVHKMFIEYEEKKNIDDPVTSKEKEVSSSIMRKSAGSAVKAAKAFRKSRKGRK